MAATCHYEVLGVDQTADSVTIKKAHRKLALKLHPDKNLDDASAAEKFRQVQLAYECLSDPGERKWYDDHRDAILRGMSAQEGDDGSSTLFDVVPYNYAGCYNQYTNDDGDFYAVYRMVFGIILGEEIDGLKDDEKSFASSLPGDFGTPDSDWELVGNFYRCWESFTSSLSFEWADEYSVFEIKEAPSRWVRRKMEDQNKRTRKAAKKTRNEDILALVRFVKRRDPRVKSKMRQIEAEKLEREALRKQESKRKKEEAREMREKWRQEADEELAAAEEVDRLAGRVRLADLEDDYDYGGGKGRKGKGKKKGKKQVESESEESDDDQASDADSVEGANATEQMEAEDPGDQIEDEGSEEDEYVSSESESEEEPDFWRCEVCRKDFKSEGQMENHMKSKKHKETVKKKAKK